MSFETIHAPERAGHSFTSVQNLEKKSLLEKGMKGAYALAYFAASKAVEGTMATVNNVTEAVSDSLTQVTAAPLGKKSPEGSQGGQG